MSLKHYDRLALKMTVMTLSFSLIPLLALGTTIYLQFTTAYESKVAESARTLVQNRRASIELFFDERIAQLNTVAQTHPIEKLKDEAFLKKIFDTLQAKSKSFIDLGVIDSQGAHQAYVGPHYDKLKSVNYAQEEWFQAVLTTGIYISDVFMGFRKAPHFIIAVTTIYNNQMYIVRATINSMIIEEMVRAAQVGKRGDAFIINRENILQTQPRFSGQLLGTPNAPNFSSAIGLAVEFAKFKNEESIYATAQIKDPRWLLVIKEDVQEEMAPLFRAHFVESLVIGFGILLVVIGTIVTTRLMTKRLEQMELEKAKTEDLVVQSSKMAALGKMAAGIAHEINNPLQIIGDQAGWMKDLLDSEDMKANENFQEFEQCIKKIERQVNRSREITHRLLRFGRRMETTQDMVDVNNLLAETITFLENEAHYRDITVQTQYDTNLPEITTDSNQLQRVFLNIIDNAIDAVGQSGKIFIKTSLISNSSKEIQVTIEDNGPGIPKEVLARIFDPFFITKRADEGTGLGLSISYSIIEKLRGKISVESEEGRGTTFIITLPIN